MFWRGLGEDLRPVPRMMQGSGRVLGPSLIALALLGISDALGPHYALWFLVSLSGLALLALSEASVLRSYAQTLSNTIADRPGTWYLWWAAVWTGWPLVVAALVFTFVAPALIAAFGDPHAVGPTTFAKAIALPFAVLFDVFWIVQIWAFSYVAIEGFSAGEAIGRVLRTLRDPSVSARAAVVSGLVAAGGFAIQPLGELLAHLMPAPAASFAFSFFPAAIGYPCFWAVLLRLPPAVEPIVLHT